MSSGGFSFMSMILIGLVIVAAVAAIVHFTSKD
jgi:hypothetical protein